MAHWQPLKSDVLAALVDDIAHNYGSGRASIGVAASDADAGARFADDLERAIANSGRSSFRGTVDADALPARDDTTADSLLVASGTTVGALTVAGHFNYVVWLDDRNDPRRDPAVRAAASAIIDNTDPDHPRRVFTDSC
jgi:hypothetical protein